MSKLAVNYHTHTYRCHHADGTDREYVESAIKNGIKVLGISDHTPMVYNGDYKSRAKMDLEETEGYFTSLCALRDEYKNDIDLRIGFEFEYYTDTFENTTKFLSRFPLDYLALGQHYIRQETRQTCSFDYTDDVERLERYYNCVREAVSTGLFMFICHPDVVHFTGNPGDYERVTVPFLEDMKKAGIPLEINVKGIEEPEQKKYPEPLFWKLAGEVGNKAIIGLDAHSPDVFADEKAIAEAFRVASDNNVNLLDNPSFPIIPGYKLDLSGIKYK